MSLSVYPGGRRMHPWEWLGRVPPWMRIPSLPGTHFKIGSRRLNFGERVTPTL